MKKSNIFLTTSVLFLLASIIVFDFGLKSRYYNGYFKNPYIEFTALDFKNFDSIYVNASTMANVKFVQGPFKVLVFEDKADIVKVTQEGTVLFIDVNTYPDNFEESPFTLIISCPKIDLLVTDDRYMVDGKLKIDTIAKPDTYNNRVIQASKKVVIEGFYQDSLSIIQNNGSHIRLVKNRLLSVTAIVGKSTKSASFLTIDEDNIFENAHFDIRNKSQLFLSKARIQNLDYKVANDAKVTFSGASVNLFP